MRLRGETWTDWHGLPRTFERAERLVDRASFADVDSPTGGWDTDKLSAAIWRVGYRTGGSDPPRCQDLHSEWAMEQQLLGPYWDMVLI